MYIVLGRHILERSWNYCGGESLKKTGGKFYKQKY